MARSSGLRDRISHALVASAGIFTLALAFWGVNTYQQSEATQTETKTTITFEEYPAPRELGTMNEYTDKGVRFSDDSGNTNRTMALSKEGAIGCTGDQIATSGTNRLHPLPNPSDPLVITFTENRVSNDVSFQLLGVQSAKNVVEFFDHTGKLLSTTEYVNPGGACDKKQLVSLSQPNIAKIRITQPGNNFSVTQDGLAIDDLRFSTLTSPTEVQPEPGVGTFTIQPTSGTAPLSVTGTYTPASGTTATDLIWNFGDGTIANDTPLGTVSVSGDGTVATSPVTLEQGVSYIIRVSGTVKYALPDPAEADAEYMSLGDGSFTQREDTWDTSNSSDPHCGTTPTLDIGLAIDDTTNYAGKTPRWGEFQSNHVYTTTYTGKGQKPTFRFMDCANGYGNNSGSFTVTILSGQSGNGSVATHTYTTAGNYTVSLSANGKAVGTKTVTVTQAATPETKATLTTSKSVYKPGEVVSFILANDGQTTLEFANAAPFTISKDATAVFQPVSAAALETLTTKKSKSWTWNQKASDGKQVAAGTYVVKVNFTANGTPLEKSTSFTVTAEEKKGTASVTIDPTTGTVPFTVSVKCTGDAKDVVVDFGDGTVVSNVTCPSTLNHTYTIGGSYTITVRQGESVIAKQLIQAGTPTIPDEKVKAPDDGKGKSAPSVLASTGTNLLLVLLIAALISGLISYFIIRRPFHGDTAK